MRRPYFVIDQRDSLSRFDTRPHYPASDRGDTGTALAVIPRTEKSIIVTVCDETGVRAVIVDICRSL